MKHLLDGCECGLVVLQIDESALPTLCDEAAEVADQDGVRREMCGRLVVDVDRVLQLYGPDCDAMRDCSDAISRLDDGVSGRVLSRQEIKYFVDDSGTDNARWEHIHGGEESERVEPIVQEERGVGGDAGGDGDR